MQSAAEAGMAEAPRLMDRTPREIALLLAARRAFLSAAWRDRVIQARLTALAVHAPDRLPALPPSPPSREMSAEEIKARLLAWRGKDESQ